VGKQLLEQVKQASRTMRFELVGVSSENFAGGTRFEIHSKMTILESGQTIYSRQFVLPGAAPREIVQITYGGASEDIFTKKDLADAIRPKTKAQ